MGSKVCEEGKEEVERRSPPSDQLPAELTCFSSLVPAQNAEQRRDVTHDTFGLLVRWIALNISTGDWLPRALTRCPLAQARSSWRPRVCGVAPRYGNNRSCSTFIDSSRFVSSTFSPFSHRTSSILLSYHQWRPRLPQRSEQCSRLLSVLLSPLEQKVSGKYEPGRRSVDANVAQRSDARRWRHQVQTCER